MVQSQMEGKNANNLISQYFKFLQLESKNAKNITTKYVAKEKAIQGPTLVKNDKIDRVRNLLFLTKHEDTLSTNKDVEIQILDKI